MKNIHQKLFIVVFSFICQGIYAQHFMGSLLDDDAYESTPQKPRLLMRSYNAMPASYSLLKYCPTALNQGQYGTCTSWSSTYYARTILEAISNNWTDKSVIDNEAFAPLFIYALIKDTIDNDCSVGTYIDKALATLKDIGAPKKSSFNVMCADDIPQELFTEANTHKIDGYTRLFGKYDGSSDKIQNVKKSLTENRPVIICMECYKSFDVPKEGLWSGEHDGWRGYHAMCVVGYDDNQYGGAFQIMNSWGKDWGQQGLVWVKYDDFCSAVHYAYEMYMNKKTQPIPQPKPQPGPEPKPLHLANVVWMNTETSVTTEKYNVIVGINSLSKVSAVQLTVNGQVVNAEPTSNGKMRGIAAVTNDGYDARINRTVVLHEGENTIGIDVTNADGVSHLQRVVTYVKPMVINKFSGGMYLQLATGERLNVTSGHSDSILVYSIAEPLISGTRYRIYMSNNSPAYVYVIGSDLRNNASKIFPTSEGVTAYLDYSTNDFALPDERYFIELDNNVGTDYLCVLFSAEELNIDEIVNGLKRSSDEPFTTQLRGLLGDKLVSLSDIDYGASSITLKANTHATVVPIVVAINHAQ